MRILYIVQQFCGPSGNWGTRPYENTRRLVQMGHHVTILCGKFDRSTPEDIAYARDAGIEIHQAPILFAQRYSNIRRMIAFQQFMNWAIKKGKSLERPDIVFSTSPPLTVGEVGRKIAVHHHVPYVFEVRDLWPEMPLAVGALSNPVLRWSANRMAKRIYETAAHIIALSAGMKERILTWGVPTEQISVIPNCSDTTLFGSTEFRNEMRKQMGWTNKFVCLYPGSMGYVNGLDYLLDAAKIIDQFEAMDIHIAIVGDGAYKDHLRKRIVDENIRSAVVYDAISKQDMPKLMSAADIGLSCFLPVSPMEANSANKFFDFLASSLPVIINYAGWQAEVLQETGAGLAVDPSSPKTLADAIVTLRGNRDHRISMGLAGRRLAEELYDRDLLVDQLESILRRLVNGKQR